MNYYIFQLVLISEKLSNNQLIESSLEKNMLGFTKSAYNALTSYNCGIYNIRETQ